ncbi:MAG: nuclease, partial [Euryarchaeota archaeon]|nr:nuclease [Euryarchaeota archaeon]
MQRRTFLTAATALGGVALGGVGSSAAVEGTESPRVMRFYSPASQIASDGTTLTDESIVRVWAEESAYNFDSSRGRSLIYEDESIPLASVDGSVAGFGAMLVPDGGQISAHVNFEYENLRVV